VISPAGRGYASRRLVSAAVLLFVFFLPLHVHFFTAATKVNNECSCVNNTRTQAAPVTVAIHWAPTFDATPVAVDKSQEFLAPQVQSYAIRAPPLSISL